MEMLGFVKSVVEEAIGLFVILESCFLVKYGGVID